MAQRVRFKTLQNNNVKLPEFAWTENIHTYFIVTSPMGLFRNNYLNYKKLLITTQLKLIKFKKHLQHYLNFVVEKNTKNK